MKTKTYAEYKKEQRGKQQSNSNCGSSHPMNKPIQLSKYATSATHKKQQLIPPGSLGTLTKATYDRLKQQPQHRRMGPTTSALVRPAPLFSRPPPGAALRVMPPKKRVKLDEDEDINKKSDDSIKSKSNILLDNTYIKGKDKLEERNRRESQRKQMRVQPNQTKLTPSNIIRVPEGTKSANAIDKNKKTMAKASRTISRSAITPRSSLSQRSQLQQRTQLQQRAPLPLRSPVPQKSPLPPRSSMPQKSPLPQRVSLAQRASLSQRSSGRAAFPIKRSHQLTQKLQTNNTHEQEYTNMEQAKQPTFLGVKFKRMKKANLADQIKRSKEGKLDLMTPDSILTSVHIKDLLNESTFKTLPPAYQYQLLMLLPECDREMSSDGALRLSQHALNNEFFTRSCQEFKDKLMDGEFNSDIIQRAKNEVELNARLDPWKVKYFEPIYGASSLNEVKKKAPPPQLEVVESSWVAFLKFSENSTDDFEEALAKMQVAVKKASQNELKENEERKKREDSTRPLDLPTRTTISQNRCAAFRSPGNLKPKNVRAETATKEKSRKALKKAQLLQRKKAFDKQLKDAKARIVEEARSSIRKEEEQEEEDNRLLKSKIFSKSYSECNVDIKRLPSYVEEEINTSARHMLNTSSPLGGGLFTPSELNKNENETSKVINLCDNMALKNLIRNSDIIKPINTFVPQLKRGPSRKRTGSRIMKGPSTFLTNSEGLCPCNLKSMVMCVQCESFWHGDCINGEQLCFLCT